MAISLVYKYLIDKWFWGGDLKGLNYMKEI